MKTPPPPDTAPGSGSDGPRPAVLLVEDNAEMRAYLRKHLARHYDVHEAGRGDDGLAAARARIPDVIVSDIMMPGLDGNALCRALKADPETDFIPVILLTARTGIGDKLEGLEGGADDYLTKPFEPEEFLLRLRNLLRSRARLAARLGSPAGLAPVAAPPVPATADAGLLARLGAVLAAESADARCDVPTLAARLGMSRAQLHRRLTQACGAAPAEVIIRFRLDRAARLLTEGAGTVGEVADAVGFRNLSHFVRRFRERFGQTPAEYRRPARNAPPR